MMSPKAKAITALLVSAVIGAFGSMVQTGIVTGDAIKWVGVATAAVMAVCTTLGVYIVPNGTATTTTEAPKA